MDQEFWTGLEAYIREKYVAEGLALHETQVIDTDLFGRVDLGEMEPGFSETVIALAKKKYDRLSDFCNKACLSKQVVSKMNTDPGYLPQKQNAFACVIALELPMEEAEELLKRGSYAFSRSCLQDVIVSYFIEQGVYNIDAINVTLFEHGEKTLGSLLLLPMLLGWCCSNGRGKPLPYGGTQAAEVVLRGSGKVLVLCG